jgi:hypothetical protein
MKRVKGWIDSDSMKPKSLGAAGSLKLNKCSSKPFQKGWSAAEICFDPFQSYSSPDP